MNFFTFYQSSKCQVSAEANSCFPHSLVVSNLHSEIRSLVRVRLLAMQDFPYWGDGGVRTATQKFAFSPLLDSTPSKFLSNPTKG